MLAFRLAEHVEKTTDVFGMLDRMSPELFEAWVAKDRIEPVGYSSQMLGMISYLMQVYMSKDPDSVKMEQFMPWLKDQLNKPRNADAKALLAGCLGKPRRTSTTTRES